MNDSDTRGLSAGGGLLLLALTAAAWAAPQGAPPSPHQGLTGVVALLETGRVDEAEAVAAGLSGEAGAEAAFRVGRARVLDRQYGKAEPLLRRALAAGYEAGAARLYLSAALWENGRVDESEELLRDDLAAGGGSRTRHQLARLLLWEGRYGEAVALLASLEAAFRSRLDLQLDAARAREGAGDFEGALRAYELCRELAPEHYEIRYGLARVLQRLDRGAEARAELAAYRRLLAEDTARTRERGRQEAQVDLARSLWVAGDADGAIAELERAVGEDPQRSDLRLLLDEWNGSREEAE